MLNNQDKLREQYNPDGSDLRRAQLRMLEMLKFIDRVCQKLSISYWLECGTLLGAARHQGFIPWDDDTDIAMPEEDYAIFEHYMLHDCKDSDFTLQCHRSDPHYYGTWGVLRDMKSRYVLNDARLNNFRYQGLQVDIFPVDRRSRNKACYRLCRWLFAWGVDAPLHEGRILKYFKWSVPINYFLLRKLVIPISHFFTPADKEYLYYRYGMFWWRKYRASDTFPLSKVVFEGEMFNAPCHVDAYLTECYGDWKTLPPEEQRYNHGFGFEFLE